VWLFLLTCTSNYRLLFVARRSVFFVIDNLKIQWPVTLVCGKQLDKRIVCEIVTKVCNLWLLCPVVVGVFKM